MNKLNLFAVHSDYLKNRAKYLNSTLDILQKLGKEEGFVVQIHVIKDPTREFIEQNIETFNKRVQYEKEEGSKADEQFNNSIIPLNTSQISNIEKHRLIYRAIEKNFPNDLNLIIEDDVLIGDEYINNIKAIFRKLKSDQEWDIIFTCVAQVNEKKFIEFQDSRDQYKLLISKSSYFVKGSLAKKLHDYLETFKYNLKVGISKYIWDNSSVKSYVLNQHTFLEGSKFGIFTTSVNHNNFLFQNGNFLQLAKKSVAENFSEEDMKEIHNIHKQLENLKNPDISHTMGLIYFKQNKYEKAKEYMLQACKELEDGFGNISKNNEILNNAINIFQYEQPLLEECKQKKSKYSA